MSDIDHRVGRRLRAIRQKRGLSVSELSSAARLAQTEVHRIEEGDERPSSETLLALAHAMNCPIEALFRDE